MDSLGSFGDPAFATVVGCFTVITLWMSVMSSFMKDGCRSCCIYSGKLPQESDGPDCWEERRIFFDIFRLLVTLFAAKTFFPTPSDQAEIPFTVAIVYVVALDALVTIVYYKWMRRDEFQRLCNSYTAFYSILAAFSVGFTLQLLITSHHDHPKNVLVNNVLRPICGLSFFVITGIVIMNMDRNQNGELPRQPYGWVILFMPALWITGVAKIGYLYGQTLLDTTEPCYLSAALNPLWLILACSLFIIHNHLFKIQQKGELLHVIPDIIHLYGICGSVSILKLNCDVPLTANNTLHHWMPLWPLLTASALQIIGYLKLCSHCCLTCKVQKKAAAKEKMTLEVTSQIMDEVSASLVESVATEVIEEQTQELVAMEVTSQIIDEVSVTEAESVAMEVREEKETEKIAAIDVTFQIIYEVSASVAGSVAMAVIEEKQAQEQVAKEVTSQIMNEVSAIVAASVAMEVIEEKQAEDQVAIEVTSQIMDEVTASVAKSVAMEVREEKQTQEQAAIDVTSQIMDEVSASVAKSVAKEVKDEEQAQEEVASDIMSKIIAEVTKTMTKSVATEVNDEERLGKTLHEEYDRKFVHKVSVAAATEQRIELETGCNIVVPPGAVMEDTVITSSAVNPHGYSGDLELKENDLLVSDIIDMGPTGTVFAKPVQLHIPHSLPKFDKEREYVVMMSSDNGTTWQELKAVSQEEFGQRYVTVETDHFTLFTVVARPLTHRREIKAGKATKLKSSPQTGVEVSFPKGCIPKDQPISFEIAPVDEDALKCAAARESTHFAGSMSHIIKFFEGSNLALKSPATVVIPLTSPAHGGRQVRVLSCDEDGDWEDITKQVDDIILKESKVLFKTKFLSSGFVVARCSDTEVKIVDIMAKNIPSKNVRTLIFKKWKEPREDGIMTVSMECVLADTVEARVHYATTKEGYELQEGTPTPSVVMLEGETMCAVFHGNIRPDVPKTVNGLYGVNFTFYCERPRRLEFNVKLVDRRKSESSQCGVYTGKIESYRPCPPDKTPATPLAKAEITSPTGITCDYWLACQRFKKTFEINESYFSPDHDKCFCETCHKDRGDPDSYLRGDPEKKYAVPVGWARFGLSLNPSFKDRGLKVFDSWHRAYHGTDPSVVQKILQNSSMLLMPGDVALGGYELGERPGHFTPVFKPDGFDTVQVFVSPSVVYAGLDAYADTVRFNDDHDGKVYDARIVFQLCIRPHSYTVGPETVGASKDGETVDPLFSNDELEWSTRERGGHALYGLLVKLDQL